MKLFVNIAFHYVAERVGFLHQVLTSVTSIKTEKTKIIINFNDVDIALMNNIVDKYPQGVIEVHKTTGLGNPFMLTWEHKKYLSEFLETDYTHYAYLEDDMKLTQENIDYWIRTRKLFKDNDVNFLPSFYRVEIRNDGNKVSVDFMYPQKIEESKCITVENEQYIFPNYPYHGMFVMDRELVEEHINSSASDFDKCKRVYDIREDANVLYIFDDVPEGYPHRAVLPLNGLDECAIHHVANNYSKDVNTLFGKILMNECFI